MVVVVDVVVVVGLDVPSIPDHEIKIYILINRGTDAGVVIQKLLLCHLGKNVLTKILISVF